MESLTNISKYSRVQHPSKKILYRVLGKAPIIYRKELMKKFLNSIRKRYNLLGVVGMGILTIFAILYFNCIVEYIIPGGVKTNPNARLELLKFFGYVIGGLLLIWQIRLTNRRTIAVEKTAEVTAQGQIQERFKNAIDQLGSEKEAVNLGAIYTLHHIAKDSEQLRKSVFDILCSYIRETTSEYEYKKRIVTSIKIQAIIDLLFTEKGEGVDYLLDYADLHGANLPGARFLSANLSGIDLTRASLVGANLMNARLHNTDLLGANLTNAHLNLAILTGALLTQAVLTDANLEGANLSGAMLTGAILTTNKLRDADFTGAFIKNMIVCPDWIETIKNNNCIGLDDFAAKYKIVALKGKDNDPVYVVENR